MNTRRRIWVPCVILGILLIVGAAALTGYNLNEEHEADIVSGAVLTELSDIIQAIPPEERVDASGDPMLQFPLSGRPELKKLSTVTVDGREYVGVITLPTLDTQLPVQSAWSYPGLKISPCLYYGTPYDDDLVICAHNYATHFGQIKELHPGDEVRFTDMDGATFSYAVGATEVLDPYATQDVVSGEWDLTLFTCTIGGRSRVVVRCDRTEHGGDDT